MTKLKTPTLASLRALAKRKGLKLLKGDSWVSVNKIGRPAFLDVYCDAESEPTREQALAMIHAALEVLPDVRGK